MMYPKSVTTLNEGWKVRLYLYEVCLITKSNVLCSFYWQTYLKDGGQNRK